MHLTRKVRFAAAHRYYRPEWSEDRNHEVFGPCANEHGHGHSYECHVTVSGLVDPDTSTVVNLPALDRILHEEVVERFDHRNINYAVADFEFGKQIPTVEALALYVWNQIKQRLPAGVSLECVRVQEDPSLYAEYRGER